MNKHLKNLKIKIPNSVTIPTFKDTDQGKNLVYPKKSKRKQDAIAIIFEKISN